MTLLIEADAKLKEFYPFFLCPSPRTMQTQMWHPSSTFVPLMQKAYVVGMAEVAIISS